jgi:hypothetical protein
MLKMADHFYVYWALPFWGYISYEDRYGICSQIERLGNLLSKHSASGKFVGKTQPIRHSSTLFDLCF